MLTISAQEYNKSLTHKLTTQNQRLPLSCIWELTYHCNLSCVHCYVDCEKQKTENRKQKSDTDKNELSYGQIRNIIDKLFDAGCIWLTFTGGEVFTRHDFIDIYDYAYQKGFIITILTNGTLITPLMLNHFTRYPPWLIEITLYGRTRKTYERITRVNGSFEQCIRTIDLLSTQQLPFRLKTMLMTLNQHELKDIQDFAHSLGFNDFLFDGFIHARRDGSKEPLTYRIPVEETVRLELADKDRLTALGSYFKEHYGRTAHDYPYQYKCGAGRTSFAINPYGELNVCLSSRELNYDLVRRPFADAFNNLFPKVICAPKQTALAQCTDCKLYGFCGQCPVKSYEENGDINQPVDYNCQRARLLADELLTTKNTKQLI
jgi:radical SAM protein with 4Fe4S-binding SPASM domain